MGLLVSIYRDKLSPRGTPSDESLSHVVIVGQPYEDICVVNMDGPFEPTEDCPAYRLEANAMDNPVLRPALDHFTPPEGFVGPMASGLYAATSDSRFGRAIRKRFHRDFYGALPLHDRYESQRTYDLLST